MFIGSRPNCPPHFMGPIHVFMRQANKRKTYRSKIVTSFIKSKKEYYSFTMISIDEVRNTGGLSYVLQLCNVK